MGRKIQQPYIMTSVKLSPEFYTFCKNYHISFSEAIRVGISILLAEKGEADYDNRLTIVRRMTTFKAEAERALQELDDLQKKMIELEEKLKEIQK